jgi:hypothetical protein
MRKLSLILALTLAGFLSKANNYKMDEQQLAQTFAKSTEVSFDQMYASSIMLTDNNLLRSGAEGGKTRVGYLVRAFFCGSIALHRYYMGTTRGGMWAMYCCIPVVGGINAFVDFWWAVFDSEAYTKYANNDKYIVWLD